MRRFIAAACVALLLGAVPSAARPQTPSVFDLPTRPGVTERVLYLPAPKAKAAAILFAGGDGAVGIGTDGTLAHADNILLRARGLFAAYGTDVAIVDAPSDRQTAPHLDGFRETAQHVADVAALIAWLRARTARPVWLVGASRGAISAAFAASRLRDPRSGGPNGVVLVSTVLVGNERGPAVTAFPLERIAVPVLVIHHRHDGCRVCPFSAVPALMRALSGSPRTEAIAFDGGVNAGDPCGAFAYHGFNKIERQVVDAIARWIAP